MLHLVFGRLQAPVEIDNEAVKFEWDDSKQSNRWADLFESRSTNKQKPWSSPQSVFHNTDQISISRILF